jgi:HSP20 family protein
MKEENKTKKQELQKMSSPRGMSRPDRFDMFSRGPFFHEMERLFDEFFPRRWWQHGLGGGVPGGRLASPFEGKVPSVDVIDRDHEFLVKAELPGVNKDDINITLTGSTITIEAKMEREETEEQENYCHREICHGTFVRTLELPAAVDENAAKASFKNGMLELTIPKVEQTKRKNVKVE